MSEKPTSEKTISAKILVVEDEPVIALDIRRQLTQLGYTVVATADRAEAALDAVNHLQPDLVLMDICIQGNQDGIETAAKIRQRHSVPIVFLTAHADTATIQQVKAVQPFGYIVKPFSNHDLTTAIEVALNRHQAEMTIQAALKAEKELNELKSRFIAIVSHEFRNPLSAIQLSIDLLERYDGRLTAGKRQHYFKQARDSVDRMKQLLEEVLILGEVDAGKLRCDPAPLNLTAFCHQLIAECQLVLNQAECSCFINFAQANNDGDREQLHYLDEKLLRHILTNLLSNAIKYSPGGGKVRLNLIYRSESITFQIQDCGIGIPADDRARLFERFHRASNAKNIPGTGLGLSIVKQCVDAHEGNITVESAVGVGTTFTVTLPSHSY